MIAFQQIKIKNSERIAKRERNNIKQSCWTPEKYQNKQSTFRTYYRLQKKFGYDFDVNGSKALQYMRQDFENKTLAILGKKQWTKKLGNKEKYERNLQYGKALKMNPLILTFTKLENRIKQKRKVYGLEALKVSRNEKIFSTKPYDFQYSRS